MAMAHHYKLKRELGLWEITLSGIGIILGAGIYALVGKAAGLAGNGLWISFLFAALLTALTGLSYAEFSSMFPKAGAEYVYTKKSFGNALAFVVGWMVIFSGVIGAATVAMGFGGYFAAIFQTPIIPVSFVLVFILSLIIFRGIKQSARIAVIFTLIETAGLLFIIALGIPFLGTVNYFDIPSASGVFSAAALIFFAFIGFEEMVRLSEETKNPSKTIPRALIIAIAATTIIYILVALVSISVLTPAELSSSPHPLADVAARETHAEFSQNLFLLLSVIALFSTSNTVLLMLLASSRITYGISRDKSLPGFLSRIHPKNQTPHIAILLIMVLALLAIMIGDITLTAKMTDFTIYVTFITINLGVIVMRYKYPKQRRRFKVPLSIGWFPILPALGALTSFVMIFSLGLEVIFYGLVLLLAGWIFYLVFVRNRKSFFKRIF